MSHDIFVCDQCFNSLKSLTVSQAKSDKILNNLKNSASSDFKSLTSKLQYQTEKYMKSSQLRVRLFADDSIIYKTIKSQKDCDSLQEDLDAAARWESDWLMTFHPDKCSVLAITNKKNPVKHNLLHNHTLESVSSAKCLGITLQSDLKWTQHTNNIVANANKSLGFLKRNLKTSNTNIKSQAYLSLVRPKLEYACSVWNPHTAEHCNKIEMVQ